MVDESVEHRIVLYLRRKKHDVISVAEKFPSFKDVDVLKFSVKGKRVLLTNDKDFGELVYKKHLPHVGIVLFRLPQQDVSAKIIKLDLLLQKHGSKLKDSVVVVTKEKIRIRKPSVPISISN
ncbi:MAG: DUF5615 family PIN-like protein [Patescibacteria group bacterium]